jgi:MFS family permease
MVKQGLHQYPKTAPRFFYGYIVVMAAFFIMVVSFGVYNSYGIFFTPLLAEFGWTRAMTSGAFSLSMIIYGILGFAVGVFNDRFGPRLVVTICGFILGFGFLLMSQITALWQLYLLFGVVVGIGMSGAWVPQLSTVARWFVRRRTLMTGIVIAGLGIGGFIGPPVISRLIATYDWRLSLVILGGIVLVVMVIAAQFLKRDPTQTGQLPHGGSERGETGLELEARSFSLREAVSTAQFWIALINLFCLGFCLVAVMIHIVPHAIDLKISAFNAANILALVVGIGIPGNYVLGGLADRIGNRWVFIIGFILMTAALCWLMPARDMWMLYLFAVVFGFAHGGMGAAESPLIAGLFGLRSHGLIYGVIHIGFTAGAALGPFITGLIFDLTGSYQMAFLLCIAVSVIGIIMVAVLRPTKRLGGRI